MTAAGRLRGLVGVPEVVDGGAAAKSVGRPRGAGGGGVARAVGRPVARPVVELGLPVLLDLLDAACAAGASVPGALASVGAAAGGERGAALGRAAGVLALGASWTEAWSGTPPEVARVLEALRPSWEDGTPPSDALRGAAESVRRERHARALEAAARLGVRLVLPLGLCYLPAFVLVGLVPVLLSMAGRALGG